MKKILFLFVSVISLLAEVVLGKNFKLFEKIQLIKPKKIEYEILLDNNLKDDTNKSIINTNKQIKTIILELKNDIKEDSVKKENKKSRTDKNIDEAKNLLKIAENIASSVKNIETKTQTPIVNDKLVINKKFDAEDINADIKGIEYISDLKINGVKDGIELELLEKYGKKFIDKLKKDSFAILQIFSFYSGNEDRNTAFSRLLNVRKYFLDKNIDTSKIIIKVKEIPNQNNSNIIRLYIE